MSTLIEDRDGGDRYLEVTNSIPQVMWRSAFDPTAMLDRTLGDLIMELVAAEMRMPDYVAVGGWMLQLRLTQAMVPRPGERE